jgi:hypothetical protein
MGIEYNIFNHANATYYDLGKGPFYVLSDTVDVLFDAKKLYEVLLEEWDTFNGESEEEKCAYFRLLSEDIERFVKGSLINQVQVYSDTGDESLYARILDYKCAGSRYGLGDQPSNEKFIASENERGSSFEKSCLGKLTIEWLKKDGWNFSHYKEDI